MFSMNRPKCPTVLDCASPLALLIARPPPRAAEDCRRPKRGRAIRSLVWAMRVQSFTWSLCLILIFACLNAWAGSSLGPSRNSGTPFLESEIIFPLEVWHNHASCIVECPNGDLLVVW